MVDAPETLGRRHGVDLSQARLVLGCRKTAHRSTLKFTGRVVNNFICKVLTFLMFLEPATGYLKGKKPVMRGHICINNGELLFIGWQLCDISEKVGSSWNRAQTKIFGRQLSSE